MNLELESVNYFLNQYFYFKEEQIQEINYSFCDTYLIFMF